MKPSSCLCMAMASGRHFMVLSRSSPMATKWSACNSINMRKHRAWAARSITRPGARSGRARSSMVTTAKLRSRS
ncbi:UNVERIFIED_CONTAM: hypothetical protein GTU68_053117 [Idotea baltica]|nr:hypothetical protein [Idotea baltica]